MKSDRYDLFFCLCLFFHPLDSSLYCIFVFHLLFYANTCKSHLEKLIVLDNKLLRIAQNCSVRTCIVDLHKRYLTLPLPLLHEYNVLCFMHKCYYGSLAIPNVFKNYFRPMSFMLMVLGLMTGYICTLLIHRLV